MPPTWIAAALYTLIVGALGLIVRWEYQRTKEVGCRAPVGERPRVPALIPQP